jgi:flagellar FliJ protein
MPRRFPLENLRDLARTQEEAAARALQTSRMRLAEAEKKLDALARYRQEYLERYRHESARGMTVSAINQFRGFLGRIETAIRTQTEEVTRQRERWELTRKRWITQKHRLSAFDVLAERHRASEAKREARIEQREQDEFAAKVYERRDQEPN